MKLRMICAFLLAIPLLVFGANAFLDFIPMDPPEGADPAGVQLLESMREGGLMVWIAGSHILVGVFLLFSSTRFLAGLLQLPISIGMVLFHFTMLPQGIAPAAVILILNVVVLLDPRRLRASLRSELDGPAT